MGIDLFFERLYTMLGLANIYGSGPGELADYLRGTASSVVGTNQFVWIGFTTIGISLLMVLVYYYLLGMLLRKPSWGSNWTWFLTMLLNSLMAFLVGTLWTRSDLHAGKMVTVDPVTNDTVGLPIDFSNCLQFGGANALIAALFFVLLTFILKWGSRDFSHIPI